MLNPTPKPNGERVPNPFFEEKPPRNGLPNCPKFNCPKFKGDNPKKFPPNPFFVGTNLEAPRRFAEIKSDASSICEYTIATIAKSVNAIIAFILFFGNQLLKVMQYLKKINKHPEG